MCQKNRRLFKLINTDGGVKVLSVVRYKMVASYLEKFHAMVEAVTEVDGYNKAAIKKARLAWELEALAMVEAGIFASKHDFRTDWKIVL
jgi:hypothetical protein